MGTLTDRFWAKVDKTDKCWLWIGAKTVGGYGQFRIEGRDAYAHRVVYEMDIAEIPTGYQVDHLCDVRNCVNPAHLEAVTQAENLRRIAERGRHWQQQKMECPRGHPYDETNTKIDQGRRRCRICLNATRRARRRRQKA